MQAAEDQPWWSEYFDDEFLHLYRPFLTREDTLREVEAVVEIFGTRYGAEVLDLACGWGRHAVELALAGCRVSGLDRSETLLRHARGMAAEAGVPVRWVRGDIRELPWSEHFPAITCFFSSLGYFLSDAEDLRALRSVRDALKPDGVFLLETMHRDLIAREFAERDWWEGERGEHVWVEREFDAVEGVSREYLRWRKPDGTSGEKFHEIRVRSATEWGALLRRAGLEPEEWYGDWNLDPFTPQSERLIVLAKRVE